MGDGQYRIPGSQSWWLAGLSVVVVVVVEAEVAAVAVASVVAVVVGRQVGRWGLLWLRRWRQWHRYCSPCRARAHRGGGGVGSAKGKYGNSRV